MWLDRVHSFVKAGRVFNHNVFLTLYHSCYTPCKCEYLHPWSLHLLLFFMLPTFLSFSHILHAVLEIHLWAQMKMLFQLEWMQADRAGPVCRGPSTCTELCSWESSTSKDGLGQAVLAPISKFKFCTTLLRLQLAGRATLCCPFSKWVHQAAELLVSGSHWRAQACSVRLSSELSLQVLGNRVLSTAELKLGQLRDTDAFLRRLEGTGLWRLCSRSLQIMPSYCRS